VSYSDIETRTELVVFVVWSGDNAADGRRHQQVMDIFEDVDDAVAYVDEMAESKDGDWERAHNQLEINMPLIRSNGTRWMAVTRKEIVRSSRRVRT
jgi:hypothetical protein